MNNPIDKRDLALLREKFGEGEALEEAKRRVESGEPLAYVIGEWYFYGLTFLLNKSCLIPRPDTEHIVERAINDIPRGGAFIDLCTGSGCIAVSALKRRPDLTAYAVEISPEACLMAEKNAALNGVSDRLTVIRGDVLGLDVSSLPSFDAVISNPPYIRSEVVPTLDVARSEPLIALDGGEDGLVFYRHILKEFPVALRRGGEFIFEIGYDQAEAMRSLSAENGFRCEILKDYGGNDRVAVVGREG